MRPDKQFTRMYFAALFFSMALLLTSCGGSQQPTGHPTKASADKQLAVIPLYVSDISTFDPVLAFDIASQEVINTIFSGLVTLDDHLNVRPQLAASYQQLPDGLTWKFTLRPNLTFSDGTPLTSKDVVYSIDRALQPAEKSTTAPFFLGLIKDSDELSAGKIKTLIGNSLLAPDPNTVIIVTNKQAPYFLDMLTYPCSYVVEKKLIDTYKTSFTDHLTAGGSSGPFKVTQYTHGQEIDFVPNPNYYGPHPQLSKVIFPFYSQNDAAYHAYQVGQVDTTGVPVSMFTSDKKRKDFVQVLQLWINYYTMNYRTPPFDNIHIRQAFALAIDKTAIASTIWKGTVIPTNHIVPQGMPGYNADLTGPDGTQNLKGNSSLAKTLLQKGMQEEHWTNISQIPPIKLTYATGNSNLDQEVTAMIQMWQKVLGITVKPDPVDYNTLLTQVTLATGNSAGLQFWGLTWVAEYPDQQDWLTRQFDRGVPNNNMNYGQNTSSDVAQQQNVQQQLEAADQNTNAAARVQAYQQAEQQLVNDVAWLPMDQETLAFLRKPTVIGVVDNADGIIPPNDWANIYIGQYQ